MLLSKVPIALAVSAAINIGVATAFKLKDAADYEIKRDLLESNYPAYKSFHGDMHAGLMPAAFPDDESAADDYSSLFFWLFQPEVDVESSNSEEQTVETFRNDTLLVWFNGGPGCSSFVGLMGEMGPVGIAKFRPGIPAPNPATVIDAPLVANPYAWTKKSAMLFVEQPGGTGFSTASSAWTEGEAEKRTEDDVARDFYAFLQNFYTVFGDELAKKKLYFTGESYAGMYIPSVARGIHLRNKKVIAKDEGYRSPSLRVVNLRGVAIGNGWIDALIQGPTTIDYAWWHGMIDLPTYRGLQAKWDQCVDGQILDSNEKPFHPFNLPDECGVGSAVMEASGSTFTYDVTTYDAYPAVLDKGATVSAFFNDPVVRESLNAPSIADHPYWLACVPGSGRRRHLKSHNQRELGILLEHDMPMSVVPYISELLDDAGIDVLMYNGDLDLACSSQSTELALESMDWSGAESWNDPSTTKWNQWNVDDQPAGHMKGFNNLQFVVVYNSGHFVPINQARNSLNMISRLLEKQSLGDQELPSFGYIVQDSKKPQKVETPAEEDGQSTRGTHGMSILTGLCGFLLGIFVSQALGKRSSSHKQLHPSISASPGLQVTETTSLRHAERDAIA